MLQKLLAGTFDGGDAASESGNTQELEGIDDPNTSTNLDGASGVPGALGSADPLGAGTPGTGNVPNGVDIGGSIGVSGKN